MLGVRRDHLVVGPEPQAGDDDVHSLRRRLRQRDVLRRHADLRGEQAADARAGSEHLVEVGAPAAAAFELPGAQAAIASTVDARERAERAGVQVRVALEHGETRARFLPVDAHGISSSTGA